MAWRPRCYRRCRPFLLGGIRWASRWEPERNARLDARYLPPGVMLAIGCVLTSDLAIPIGLHISWDLFQGGVYGFPVSGLGVDVAIVAVSQRDSDHWTGVRSGPRPVSSVWSSCSWASSSSATSVLATGCSMSTLRSQSLSCGGAVDLTNIC